MTTTKPGLLSGVISTLLGSDGGSLLGDCSPIEVGGSKYLPLFVSPSSCFANRFTSSRRWCSPQRPVPRQGRLLQPLPSRLCWRTCQHCSALHRPRQHRRLMDCIKWDRCWDYISFLLSGIRCWRVMGPVLLVLSILQVNALMTDQICLYLTVK